MNDTKVNDLSNEIENLEESIEKTIRLKGFYRMPMVSAYPPAMKVLRDMVERGLLTERQHGREIFFSATNKIVKTVVVRSIPAKKIQSGFTVGRAKTIRVISRINNRFAEVDASNFEMLGLVSKVETKMVPANFWEMLTFKKNCRKTVLKFYNNTTVVVNPDDELMKVR